MRAVQCAASWHGALLFIVLLALWARSYPSVADGFQFAAAVCVYRPPVAFWPAVVVLVPAACRRVHRRLVAARAASRIALVAAAVRRRSTAANYRRLATPCPCA